MAMRRCLSTDYALDEKQVILGDPKLSAIISTLNQKFSGPEALPLHDRVRSSLLRARATIPLGRVLGHDKAGNAITIATLTHLFNRHTYTKEDLEPLGTQT